MVDTLKPLFTKSRQATFVEFQELWQKAESRVNFRGDAYIQDKEFWFEVINFTLIVRVEGFAEAAFSDIIETVQAVCIRFEFVRQKLF